MELFVMLNVPVLYVHYSPPQCISILWLPNIYATAVAS